MQGAARQGGIAAQGHGKVAAKVDRNALRGSKEQMAMDGSAPIEVEGYGELIEDGEQADAQQHGDVAIMPLHGAASSMPAHGSGHVVVDGEGGGGVRGKRASSSERARTKAERGHGNNSIHIVTICTSTKDGEGKSATTRRVTRATAAMASTDDRAARGGQGGRGRGRERGRGRGGRVGRGASTGLAEFLRRNGPNRRFLRARGSVSSGTPPEQDVTLVLPLRERERENRYREVPPSSNSTG